MKAIQCRRLRWTESVSCVEEKRKSYEVWWGKLKAREYLQDLGVDGRMILE